MELFLVLANLYNFAQILPIDEQNLPSLDKIKGLTIIELFNGNMVRHIWIVRHGERVDNVDPDWKDIAPRGAWDDPPLTSRGLCQAREVGIRLAKFKHHEPIDYIFSSPFTRCLQTTTNIIEAIRDESVKEAGGNQEAAESLPKIFVEPGFGEAMNVSQFPPGYVDIKELELLYPDIDANYKPCITKDELKPETTSVCCFERVKHTLNWAIENYSGNILIVSHGSPISGCHAALTGEFKYVGQCTISKYSVSDCDNQLINNDIDDPNSLPSREVKKVEEIVQLEDKKLIPLENSETELKHKSQRRRSSLCKAMKLTNDKDKHRKLIFKCLLIGDSSHLSDRKNLRDVIKISAVDKAMLDKQLCK
uniref:Phosphoglycerate mutase n=1 Tax=Ditylenchus dipsaci TaxID=166011 RepID=A0A915CYP1_9BILA